MTWTRFMDMHSGGDTKIAPYNKILVELPEAEARAWFYRVLNRDPDHVTCSCCGPDYSVSESGTLDEATDYDRNCECAVEDGQVIERQSKYVSKESEIVPLADYIARPDVLVVRADKLEDARRVLS